MPEKLSPHDLHDFLVKSDVGFFCGVPDSLVSSFSFFLESNTNEHHKIAANEGNAIGLAIGYHLATNKLALVYMQNSGLSNAIDPLASLADPTVFGIPMILLISWRGQPGKKDEPQHEKQGAITTKLLETLGIPYKVLSTNPQKAKTQIKAAARNSKTQKRPYALLLEDGTLADYRFEINSDYLLSREQAIEIVINNLDKTDVVVSNIGKTSRELFEYREKKQEGHNNDLLVVGGMGHASSIASAIAQQKSDRSIYCLDGDGSVLMHMGSLANIGTSGLTNFKHLVFNNGVHDSVGGQPTVGLKIDLTAVAKACGYKHIKVVNQPDEFKKALKQIKTAKGPAFLEIRVHTGARSDLTRPTIHPTNNKEDFMSFLSSDVVKLDQDYE